MADVKEPDWWKTYGQKLREPFPPDLVETLPKAGVQLKYVGHAPVTDRLIQSDPLWSWGPMARDEHGAPFILFDTERGKAVFWILLTVGGKTLPGVGVVDIGKAELEKELISDALRNAAMRFGVALDLWGPDLAEARPVRKAGKKSTLKPEWEDAAPAKPDWKQTALALMLTDPVGWQDTVNRIEGLCTLMADAQIWAPDVLAHKLGGRPVEEALPDLESAGVLWGQVREAAARDLEKR
jgi:hypothetical protein